MTLQSARSMAVLSLGLLLAGAMLGSPAAGFAVTVLAACCALIPVVFGAGGVRIIAVLVLIGSVSLSVGLFTAAKKDMDGYREHARAADSPRPAAVR